MEKWEFYMLFSTRNKWKGHLWLNCVAFFTFVLFSPLPQGMPEVVSYNDYYYVPCIFLASGEGAWVRQRNQYFLAMMFLSDLSRFVL